MKRLALASAALLLLAACSDETTPERAPTAPASPLLSQSARTAPPKAVSTVCLSYMTQLANAEEKLAKAPAEVALEKKLEKKVESLDKLTADACR